MGSGWRIEINGIEEGKLKAFDSFCTTVPYFSHVGGKGRIHIGREKI